MPAPLKSRRKRRWPRIVLWSVACLLVLLLLGIGAGVLWLHSVTLASLPQLDGDVHLAGLSAPVLSAPVTVRRDAHGVPHIDAATLDDLLVAQGYVTAQDRLWQMDSIRRSANGGLAEVLGPALVEQDKVQRVLQIRLNAQRVYDHLPPADRAYIDDYARGVNLYIAQCEKSNTLPVEFHLLMYRPQPWTGVDTISAGLAMVQTLDTHVETKLSRAVVSARLHNPALEADLYPVGSWRDHPPTGIRVDLTEPQPLPTIPKNDDEDDENSETRLAPGNAPAPDAAPAPTALPAPQVMALLGLPVCDGCAVGSNNWVVAGSHTTSGKPLLSNDMHLTLRIPDTWYMADLRAPRFHAAGVTLPGMPFVIAGHNDHVAWGFTALLADVQDLYIEKLDGKGNYESSDAQWRPLTVDREVIHVRGAKDVILNVESTAYGPLLNPILPNGDPPTALKWTLYDPSLNTIPLYAMNVASNWIDFSAALAHWSWPTQNLVYADDQGHIAYHAVGAVPIRPAGLVDVPIADHAHEWQGYIPFDAMPNVLDPPSGFLATANSRVTTDKSPYPLTLDWIDPYRTERIYKMLDGRDQFTPKDMLAAQTDIYSEVDQEMGQRFAYAIDHTPGPEGNGDPEMRKAADLMRSWDGRLTTDSVAASLVTETRAALWPLILEPKLGKQADDYHWSEKNFAEEEIVMHTKPEWLPKKYKNWDALLTAAVRKGMQDGKAPSDLSQWTYGSWHVVDIEHPLARFLPLIGRIAGTGPQPQSGDGTTVKQVGRTLGPSQRFTMDWSNIDASTENIVLGESGNPFSLYFRDQWSDWYNGTTFPLPFTPAAVAAENPPHAAPAAMKKQGTANRDQGPGTAEGPPLLLGRYLGLVLIFFAAFVAIIPQLIRGNSCGHDFDVHLVSWLDCVNAWRHGIPYPHWAPSPNYGAGEPRFVYYPPLTWILGAALGLVLPWHLAPIVLTFLTLAGTGLATRALALQALDDIPATLAGCAALFSGFALFTGYERSAFPEFAGGVWLPLLLLLTLRDRNRSPSRAHRAPLMARIFDGSTAPLAVMLALAWLSNLPLGVMAGYLLAAVAILWALVNKTWAPVLRAAVAAVLGLGLAAIYWLPAAWERNWVDIRQATQDPGYNFENNWLFARNANPLLSLHNVVLNQASWIAVSMIAVAVASLIVCWRRGTLPFLKNTASRRWWIPLAAIPIAVCFLMFPISRPLWHLLPEMPFLQYPWRWLEAVEAPMAIFFVAAIWPSTQRCRTIVIAACTAAFLAATAFAGTYFFQVCYPEDTVASTLVDFRAGAGFEGMYEYEPPGGDDSSIATGLPDACLVDDPSIMLGKPNPDDPDANPIWTPNQGACLATFPAVEGSQTNPEHRRIHAAIPEHGYLVLRLVSFPAWNIRVNGLLVSALPKRNDGLIAVPVPQGAVDLTMDWTTTPDVIASRWVSALSVMLLIALFLLELRAKGPRLT